MYNFDNATVGDKVFIHSRSSNSSTVARKPIVKTITAVTAKQITLEDGGKYNRNNGDAWGDSKYGSYIRPYSEEEYIDTMSRYNRGQLILSAQKHIDTLNEKRNFIRLEGEKLNQFIATLETAKALLNNKE